MEAAEPQPAREPLVSVIIVSYNVKDLLLDSLTALFQRTEIPFEAVVVDNNSKDGSAAAVEAEFPEVKVHRMRKNVGFGRAANAGLEHTSGRFILVLNPDVMVSEGCLGELADFLLVRPDAGAVGPRIIQPDGKLDEGARRAFPTPSVAVYRAIGLSRLFPHSPRFGRYNLTFGVNASNAINHTNYAAPSGDLSSPYFGVSRSLAGGFATMGGGGATFNRKVDVSLRFSF